MYLCIFIGLRKLGKEKTNRTSLFTEDVALVDEDEFLPLICLQMYHQPQHSK